MQNIGDKVDNTPGASGELTAAEYNDHKNEIQEPVTSSGQTLSGLKTPDQLSRASFIYGTAAQTMVDAAPSANVIELTPLTGAAGLIVSDAYTQMDGMIVEFDKPSANTSNAVTVNFGQTGGTLLGAKSLKKQDGNNPLIGQVQGRVKIQFDASSDYWILLPYSSISVPVGYIETELDISGTSLVVRNPCIEIGGLLVKRSDITIDLTALVASTWYALCCREDTGAISAQNISSVFNTGGGGNWDISGNQLDIYDSIWDNDRKYCRAYDATYYYRVFGVFKTNSTPNGVDVIRSNQLLFYIPNIPKPDFYVYRNANFATSGSTQIEFDTVSYDINSEWSTSNYRYTPKFVNNIILSSGIENATTALSATYPRSMVFKNSTAQNLAFARWERSVVSASIVMNIEKIFKSVLGDYYAVFIAIDGKSILGGEANYFQGIGI